MKRLNFIYPLAILSLLGCQEAQKNGSGEDSTVKVTSVKHTDVKRQSIGNCWVYAQATWLEAMLKSTDDSNVNVSESYWTYWHFYNELRDSLFSSRPPEEIQTGGGWDLSVDIIREHGWVTEEEFIKGDSYNNPRGEMSGAQECAVEYLNNGLKDPESSLMKLRTLQEAERDAAIRSELKEAFSCAHASSTLKSKYSLRGERPFEIDIAAAEAKARSTDSTMLANPKNPSEPQKPLSAWLNDWKEYSHPLYEYPYSYTHGIVFYEGKKLLPLEIEESLKEYETAIKLALNDHQPVPMSFVWTAKAIKADSVSKSSIYSMKNLAQQREPADEMAGHMLVMHDYTTRNAPGFENGIAGEGDFMDAELKARAAEGDLDYFVVKNSWGFDRGDRGFLNAHDEAEGIKKLPGYTRFSWELMKQMSYDAKKKVFRPFLSSIVVPPGY